MSSKGSSAKVHAAASPPPEDDGHFECEKNCGFYGGYDAVCAHEESCTGRPAGPLLKLLHNAEGAPPAAAATDADVAAAAAAAAVAVGKAAEAAHQPPVHHHSHHGRNKHLAGSAARKANRAAKARLHEERRAVAAADKQATRSTPGGGGGVPAPARPAAADRKASTGAASASRRQSTLPPPATAAKAGATGWLVYPEQRKSWDAVMIVLLLYTASVTPYEVAFLTTSLDGLFVVSFLTTYLLTYASCFLVLLLTHDSLPRCFPLPTSLLLRCCQPTR